MNNIPVVLARIHLNGEVVPLIMARLLGNIEDGEIVQVARDIVRRCRSEEPECSWSRPQVAFLYFGMAERPQRSTITVWDGLTRIKVTILNGNTGESPELEMFRPYWEFLVAARKSLLSGKGAVQTVEELSISPLRIWRDGNITKEHAYSEIQALENALRADGYIHA